MLSSIRNRIIPSIVARSSSSSSSSSSSFNRILVQSPLVYREVTSNKRLFCTSRPLRHDGTAATSWTPHTSSIAKEFDGDAADFVVKEVSVHERAQTMLTDAAKLAAKMADYNGDHHSSVFTSGRTHPETVTATSTESLHYDAESNMRIVLM